MKGVIVIGNNLSPELAKHECAGSYVIGADKGALYCYKNQIPMDVAVGDFDSLSEKEKENVLSYAKNSVILNPVKDDTDTAHALSLLKDCDEVTILGGIAGRRIEHFLAILDLLAADTRISLKDDDSSIQVLGPGEYELEKGVYRFFSFFALEDSIVTLDGFAYPLNCYLLKRFDPLGVSNQMQREKAHVKIEKGKLLFVSSRSDS